MLEQPKLEKCQSSNAKSLRSSLEIALERSNDINEICEIHNKTYERNDWFFSEKSPSKLIRKTTRR